jgi:hypothetical protein
MNRCFAAGAGTMLFLWAAGVVVAEVFERELGELGGFLILGMGFVGAWAGMAVRKECRAKVAKAAEGASRP